MSSYEYTEVNRLERPHKYIYTPYLGEKFVSFYFSDRLKHLKQFQEIYKTTADTSEDLSLCMEAKKVFNGLLKKELFELDSKDVFRSIPLSYKNIKTKNLSLFETEDYIDTELLLSSLVYSQLNHKKGKSVKKWLDYLLQRFEVTKKLYVRYSVGFFKGDGAEDNVRLYWLFSLSLCLYYANTKNIKYLSTLLKVSDLLCSLGGNFLVSKIPLQGLSMIIQVEMFYVRLILGKNRKVSFGYK